MQSKPIAVITVLLVVVASLLVSGCTTSTTSNTNQAPSASTATARDYAQNYLNVTISSLSKNETIANQKIVDNGTDTVMLSYAITNETSQPIIYTNGFTTTFGLNVKRFASIDEATRFYEQTSLGYTPYQPTLNASIYKTTTGHNPTINNESRRLNSITQASIAIQQDEFVTWGIASVTSAATVTPSPTATIATTTTPTAKATATPTPTPSGTIATTIQFASDPTVAKGGILEINVIASGITICGHGAVTATIGTISSVGSSDCFHTAYLDTSGLSQGAHAITLKFAGDSTYQASQLTSTITLT